MPNKNFILFVTVLVSLLATAVSFDVSMLKSAYAESNQQPKVILYATTWCPYCEKARQLFQKHNIPYTEFDIEKSSEGKAQYELLGISGVPITVINGKVIQGFDVEGILNTYKSAAGQ